MICLNYLKKRCDVEKCEYLHIYVDTQYMCIYNATIGCNRENCKYLHKSKKEWELYTKRFEIQEENRIKYIKELAEKEYDKNKNKNNKCMRLQYIYVLKGEEDNRYYSYKSDIYIRTTLSRSEFEKDIESKMKLNLKYYKILSITEHTISDNINDLLYVNYSIRNKVDGKYVEIFDEYIIPDEYTSSSIYDPQIYIDFKIDEYLKDTKLNENLINKIKSILTYD